jgi:polar amino acid transport system substrate-binding protein
MRRIVLLFLAALLPVVGACSSDDDGKASTSKTKTRTSDTGPKTVTEEARKLDTAGEGKLTVCTELPRVPFAFEEKGETVGLDVEIVRAVAGRLGLPPEFRDTDASELFRDLDAGRCDLVASAVAITEERKQQADFSPPYLDVTQSLLVRKADAARYTSFASLQGRTVGVQSGTAGAALADREAPPQGITVRKLPSTDELFTALKAGDVDAVVHDHPLLAYHASTTGETAVSAQLPGEKVEYGIAVRRGRTELLTAIDDALKAVRGDDTYKTIIRTYYGDDRK